MATKRRLQSEPRTLPKPEAGETHDDFMTRCTGEGNSAEECEMFWKEGAAAEEQQGDLPEPSADESEEDFMGRCVEAGGTEDECQMIWDEANAEPEEPTPGPTETRGTRRRMPKAPKWLKAMTDAAPAGVDRKAGIIHGVVIAQAGAFKSEGRGEFDEEGLAAIVELASVHSAGLKARFTHPTMSDDGLGKFLGRHRNFRTDAISVEKDGQAVTVAAVRADLHLDPTSLQPPPSGGMPLGQYVMDLAESDPSALGCSLVGVYEDLFRTDQKGRPLADENGQPLPPLWIPKKIHAADVVDYPDATDTFLSAHRLPDAAVRQGVRLLNGVFQGQTREVTEARLLAFVDRYLEHVFGPPRTPRLDRAKEKLRGLTATGKRA